MNAKNCRFIALMAALLPISVCAANTPVGEVSGTTEEGNQLVSISFSPQTYSGGLGSIVFNSLSYSPIKSGTSGHTSTGYSRMMIDNGLAEGYYWLNPTEVERSSIDEDNIVFRSSIPGSTPYYGTNTPVAFAGISEWGVKGQKGFIKVNLKKKITGSLNLENYSGSGQYYSVALCIPRKNYDSEGNVTGTSMIVSDNAVLVENEFSVKIAYAPWGSSLQTMKWNKPSDTATELNNYRYHHFTDSSTIWSQTVGTGHMVFQEVACDRVLDLRSLVTGCTHSEGTPWDDNYGAGIVQTHDRSYEITKDVLKTYGLSFRFAIPTTIYSTGVGGGVNQQEYAEVDAFRGILRPKGNLAECVGKEPIIRIMLVDEINNKLVDERYMKIKWTEPMGGSGQTLDFAEMPALTYGASPYTLPQKTAEGQYLNWSIDDTSVATIYGNVLTIKKSGMATVTAFQSGNSSYLPFTQTFTLIVNKAPLTITANDCTKTAGEENPELTVSYSGFVNNETVSSLKSLPVVSTIATVDSPAGVYPITASGAEADNYDITYVDGTLTVLIDVSANNHLYATGMTINLTQPQETIALQLDNENTFIACEFFLQLPTGFTIEEDEDGYLMADIVSNRSNRHIFEARNDGSGKYHFLCYSNSNKPFKGTSGDFITLSIVADQTVTEGTYTAELKNVIFSDENKVQANLANTSFTITVVDYTPGDVNGDGKLNVMDIVEMVGNIMGDDSDTFVFVAADIDGNGTVNVMDLVNLVEIIMNTASQAPTKTAFDPSCTQAAFGNMELVKDDGYAVTISVPDADKHIAAQFIVTLSDGGALLGVASDRAHQSQFIRLDDGRYLVMVYSNSNASFKNDSAIRLQMSGNYNVKVEDLVFVDTTEEAVAYETAMLSTTGVMTVGSAFDSPFDIFSVDGTLVKKDATSMLGLAKGVYVVNGKKVIVK